MGCTLAELISALNCSYDFVNNLIRRSVLKTKLEPGIPGKPRTFSRENALEIGFLSILTAVGFAHSDASEKAQLWLECEPNGLLREWYIYNPLSDGRMDSFMGFKGGIADFPLDYIAGLFPDNRESANTEKTASKQPCSSLIILRPGEIVRRVDGIFKRDETVVTKAASVTS
jgi:hypothetical protein